RSPCSGKKWSQLKMMSTPNSAPRSTAPRMAAYSACWGWSWRAMRTGRLIPPACHTPVRSGDGGPVGRRPHLVLEPARLGQHQLEQRLDMGVVHSEMGRLFLDQVEQLALTVRNVDRKPPGLLDTTDL